MANYIDIALDILLLVFCYSLSHILVNLYPGRVQASSTGRGDVSIIEKKRRFRATVQSFYLLILAVSVHGELALGMLLPISSSLQELLVVNMQLSDVWLLLCAVALVIHGGEYLVRLSLLRQGDAFPLPNLLISLIRWTLLGGAALIIGQQVYQWHVSAVVAPTVMLSVVVGYAVKGTISDLLAGIALNVSRSVLPSQWILLPSPNFPDSRLTGEVISTNWRETRLRSTSGHVYIIPNSKVATAVLHNMSWPDANRRHNIHIIVAFDSPPDEVIEALITSAVGQKGVLEHPKAPQSMIVGFMEYGVKYRLRFWSQVYHDKTTLEGAILRSVWDQFHQRGIRLPLTQDVLIQKGVRS
jgi:small-conductance mechanosensitive channel